jgi:hypothetical protein
MTSSHAGPAMTELELDALLRRLHLANMRRVYGQVIVRAEQEQWSYRDFLTLLIAEEVAHRKQTRLQRLTRKARFPYLKTIEDFDFSLQSNLRASLLGSYLGLDFVAEGRSLILHRTRKDSPCSCDRLPGDSERVRDPVHHSGPTDRGSIQCQSAWSTAYRS